MGREIEGAATSQVLVGIDLVTLQAMRDDLERRMPGYEELGIRILLDDYRAQLESIEREIRQRLDDSDNRHQSQMGRPYLPGSRPEYTRDAAFAAICRGAR